LALASLPWLSYSAPLALASLPLAFIFRAFGAGILALAFIFRALARGISDFLCKNLRKRAKCARRKSLPRVVALRLARKSVKSHTNLTVNCDYR
jgi:hypothetical protein